MLRCVDYVDVNSDFYTEGIEKNFEARFLNLDGKVL